jgi:hypothetical protein
MVSTPCSSVDVGLPPASRTDRLMPPRRELASITPPAGAPVQQPGVNPWSTSRRRAADSREARPSRAATPAIRRSGNQRRVRHVLSQVMASLVGSRYGSDRFVTWLTVPETHKSSPGTWYRTAPDAPEWPTIGATGRRPRPRSPRGRPRLSPRPSSGRRPSVRDHGSRCVTLSACRPVSPVARRGPGGRWVGRASEPPAAGHDGRGPGIWREANGPAGPPVVHASARIVAKDEDSSTTRPT